MYSNILIALYQTRLWQAANDIALCAM